MKRTMLGVTAASFGGGIISGCSRPLSGMRSGVTGGSQSTGRTGIVERNEKSELSFVVETDVREAAYRSLLPLSDTVAAAIGNRRVVIKPNAGVIGPEHRHEVADVNQLRGILDFLKPLHDREIIVAEGTAAQAVSMSYGYVEYGYTALEKEYNVRLVDANDLPTTTKWILAGYHRPQPINVINLYLDPDVFLISACRLKTSGGVLVTLSIKNIAMGSPVCHYRRNRNRKPRDLLERVEPRGLNEKANMHGGLGSKQGRELSYNIFTLAAMGIHPDLAVLDGVVGGEGNGPWSADPIEHGVALASNDCVAADRIASELMGVDYDYLQYMQWCAKAGIGRDDPGEVKYYGPDYKPYIKQYRLNANWERQVEWIHELRENMS